MIPERLLWPITLQRRRVTLDEYGAAVPAGWDDVPLTGRVDQRSRDEATGQGRQGDVTEWLLVTNHADVQPLDRVVAGGVIYEVVGSPWPAYGASAVHHFEATLRAVVG